MSSPSLSKKQSLFGFAFILCFSFILGLTELSIIAILPELATHFSVKLQSVSLLVSLFALSYAVFTPFFSIRLQHISIFKSFLILVAYFGSLFLLTHIALAFKIFPLFFFSRIALASVCGILLSLLLQSLKYLHLKRSNAWAMGLVFSGFSLASLLGMPFFQSLAGIQFLQTAFYIFTAFTLFTILGLIFSFKPLYFKIHENPSAFSPSSWKSLYQENLNFILSPKVFRAMLFSIFFPTSSYLIFTYLSPFFSEVLGFNKEFLSPYLFLFGLLTLFSSIFSSKISVLNKHTVTLKRLALLQSGLFVLLAISIQVQNIYLGLLCLTGVAVLIYLINVPLQEIFENESQVYFPQAQNLASSIYSLSFNLGIALGAFLSGFLYEQGFIQGLVLLASLFAFLAFLTMPKEHFSNSVPTVQ